MVLRGSTLEREGRGFLPSPKGRENHLVSFSPFHALAGSSDPNYSSIFEGLPPSLGL